MAAFLLARLNEDEAAAKLAASRPLGESWNDGTRLTAVSAHIKRHDPARVLREVQAKAAIVGAYVAAEDEVPAAEDVFEVSDGVVFGEAGALRAVVKHLAAVWSDHPDYDEAWLG